MKLVGIVGFIVEDLYNCKLMIFMVNCFNNIVDIEVVLIKDVLMFFEDDD